MSSLLEQAITRLHARGGRMTRQRRVIIETLSELSGHPTAEEVYLRARARDPRIHLSTVYRTLRWLQEEGLVQGRRFEQKQRQERFDPNLPVEHFHFVCRVCGEVWEFTPPPETQTIIERFAAQSSSQVEHASMTLHGVCSNCRESSQ